MYRDLEGWHSPPSNEPPRLPPLDYAEDDPPYVGLHPLRKGAAAAWTVIGAVGACFALPFGIIAGAIALFWWEVLLWLTKER